VVQLDNGDAVELSLTTSADRPVSARLSDLRGVLLAESEAEGTASARLRVSGLSPGTYLLQVVPGFPVGRGGTSLRLGLQ
jgi:hypothetical protein